MKEKRCDAYQKWADECSKQKKIEIPGGVVIVVLLVFGASFDVIETNFLPVKDFSNVSLTALQIQASISSISIALVALISGVVSDEYYGLSITHYYLNIKPLLFKQNRIIIGSICLVAINVGAHLLGAYNLVIAILWVSCVVIIISVTEIYAAFSGRHVTIVEMKMYLDYILLDSSVSFEKKEDYFSNYVDYWSLLSQNSVDYDNEKQRYEKAVYALLEKDVERALVLLQVVSADLVKKFMAVGDINKRYRAIEVFEETYNQIWHYILAHELLHINSSFELYTECERELIPGMYTLPVESFERTVYWERLTDIISIINIYCHSNKETDIESLNKSMKQIRWIPSSIGAILAEKRKNGERVNLNYWTYSRRFLFSSNANIPDNVKTEYMKVKRQYEVAFYYSLVRNNQQEIASTIFKNNSLQSAVNRYDDIVFSLLIICYTYYIAERESTKCISLEEKESAKKLLNVFKIDDVFIDTIQTISWHSSSVDFSGLYDEMRLVLNDYERMPFDGSCKSCIVDSVVRDFVLFVAVLSCAYGSRNNLLESVISGQNAYSWYSSYLGNNFEATEKRLSKMMQVLSGESGHDARLLARGLGEFNSYVLNKYKVQSLIDARKEYLDFASKNANGVLIHSLEESLKAHLQEKCGEWLKDPERKYSEERFHLLKYTIQIHFMDDDIGRYIIPYLESKMIEVIGNRLYMLKKLDLFERDELNERDYFSIISSTKYTLVGPDWVFNPYDYKQRKDFDQLSSGYRRISMGNGNTGILLNELPVPIGIEKVSISTHHMNFSECKCSVDEETGLYLYSPSTGGTLQYTKEELEEYLFNESMIMDITVRLNIENPPTKCGLLVRKKTHLPD